MSVNLHALGMLVGSLLGAVPGCASPRATAPAQGSPRPLGFLASAPASRPPTPLWSRKVDALMTDLAVSADASSVLLATLPNPDLPGATAGGKPRLVRLDARGKPAWSRELASSVRFLAAGARAYVSTYDEQVLSFPAAARSAGWKRPAQCRPILFGPARVLCYHDDDAAPRVAFEVWDARGAKLAEFPIEGDILDLEVSADAKWILLALTGGRLTLVNDAFKAAWSQKVEGEIIDVAVSAGTSPRIAALSSVPQLQQRVTWLGADGAKLASFSPAWHADQLEIAPDASGAAIYGNGSLAHGQYLAWLKWDGEGLREAWSRGDEHAAEYQSSISLTATGVLVGYEQVAPDALGRLNHVLEFDRTGQLRWDLSLVTEPGAYLYTQVFAPLARVVVVGTDDGWIKSYKIK